MAKTCSNCDYCAENGGDLVCVNEQSEYLADFVSEDHSCVDWSGNDGEEDE